EPTDSTQDAARIGTIQRRIPTALQNKAGPPGVMRSVTDRSNSLCNKPRHCRAASGICQASKAKPPPQAKALESSRDRATCPFSRAFLRLCGVGFSVLF